MKTVLVLCAVVVAVLFPGLCSVASGRDCFETESLRQVRPNPSPPRPNSLDEVVREYSRLKSANARNTDLGRVIRYASSFKEPEAVRWLKGIFDSEKDSYLRQTSVTTLGNMHTKEAAAALMEIHAKVRKGTDANMTRSVTQALARVAEFLPFQTLVELLKNAKGGYERSDIARAIGKLGNKEAVSVLIRNVNLDQSDPNASTLNDRYRMTTVIAETIRDCRNDEVIDWLVGEILPDRKVAEAARIAIIKGFGDRSRRAHEHVQREQESEEKRKKEEEERKKAQEAAKKDPGAAPPPPVVGRPTTKRPEPPAPVSASRLVGLLDDRSVMVRAAVAEFLGTSGEGSVIPALVEHLSEKQQEALLRIVFALGELEAQSAVQPLLDLLRKAKWEIKAAIIDALGRIGDPCVVETLKKHLDDRRWQVRAAAIDALSRIRTKDSVTALIERMKKESGRLLGDIARALEKLTALELGSDAKAWDNWWKVARDRYVLPEEVTASPETANPGIAQGPKTELTKTPKYHGIDVISHRICFIIDISGSMSSQMRRSGQSPGQGQPGQPGQPRSPGTADPSKQGQGEKKEEPIFKGQKKRVEPKDNSKIEFAKAELINCIIALNPKVHFNIICFENNIQVWRNRLVPAGRDNKSDAMRWVTAMRPTGATNLGDAVLQAFEDKDVDTIFVLSDGMPNQGKLPSPDMILSEVRRLNASRRIVIHTINFSGAQDFMKKLAGENGGQFVDY